MDSFSDYFNVCRTCVANPLETEDRISSTTDNITWNRFFPPSFFISKNNFIERRLLHAKNIYEQNIAPEIKKGKHSMENLPYNNHYEIANTKTLLRSLP